MMHRREAFFRKDFILYHCLKRKIKDMIVSAKIKWANKTSKSANRIWQLVKTIKNSSYCNENILLEPNSFNYIVTLFKSYFNSNNNTQCLDFDASNYLDVDVDCETVLKIIDSIPVKKSCGIEGLNTGYIKAIAPFICEPLTVIINLCFKNCIFPDMWKFAPVVPIPKCNRPTLNDFRPISITPVFGKIIEKIFVLNFKNDLIEHFGSCQHAYRSCTSASTALAEYNEIVTSALDREDVKAVRVVFYDLEKAFDKVRHDLLVKMLFEKVGSPIAKFVQSYLYNRKFCVKIGNRLSDHIDCVSSVPAGSILGPFLFNFFLGDMVCNFYNVTKNSDIILFADDIANIELIQCIDLNDHVSTTPVIDSWLSTFDLPINFKKRHQLFYKKCNTHLDIHAPIDNIEIVTTHKYLGVLISNNFSLKNHINCTLAKAARGLFVLRYLKKLNFVKKSELLNVYN